MQRKLTVERQRAISGTRFRQRQRATQAAVISITLRRDGVQAIHRPAQQDHYQALLQLGICEGEPQGHH